nr:hypothetical protein [Paraliobacillus zengyii]
MHQIYDGALTIDITYQNFANKKKAVSKSNGVVGKIGKNIPIVPNASVIDPTII